ncbi:MAG: 4Fe-4S binding protein [Dethiobacter sp.]|jgi:dihydroorotate dehydrogenase/NAD-dependent dihydropyrimidine dehydrogenase PreA subunit|nr:4Fe-4S binding protein [Dethiobacter sp.]
MEFKVNLSVEIAEIKFSNPLLLSEGPLTGSAELIRRAAQHSIGGIVTKSIRQQKALSPNPYMISYGKGLLNADWTDMGFDAWCRELRQLEIPMPLITNVATNHVPPKQAAEFASILQDCGASLVTFSDYEPENLIQAVSHARKNVKVPIMVKLPPFLPKVGNICKRLEDVGVNCIAAMDAVGPGLDIDIETGKPVLGSIDGGGYLSGAPIFPLSLFYIAEICKNVSVPVVGVGGVTNYKDVLKMIMAGATGVGIVTGAILKGLGLFDEIEKDLVTYLQERKINNLSEIRGKLHTHLADREEHFSWRPHVDQYRCNGCGLCSRSCFKGAISIADSTAKINLDMCSGCGVCATVCGRRSIK